MKNPPKIADATGKLGILLVGMGAVSTTTIAGVLAVRRGLAPPIGALTQMGTIRLGKRTEGRSPLINEFVPLAALDNIVVGAWEHERPDPWLTTDISTTQPPPCGTSSGADSRSTAGRSKFCRAVTP